MAKILHLIPDEKVTDNVIENFERIFNDNVFYVLGDNDHRKYCKSTGANIIFGDENFFVSSNVDDNVKGIIIHGLNHIFARMILGVDKNVIIAWYAWGYDIYNLPKLMHRLYAKKTSELVLKVDKTYFFKSFIKRNPFLRNIYYKVFLKTFDPFLLYEKAHKRIDFFCTYIKEDYELFNSKYITSSVFFNVGYFSIKQYLVGQESLKVNDNSSNILIGNSNSAECNHLDIFEKLKSNCKDFNGKLIVPLNYGSNFRYRKRVVEDGQIKFENSFYPLMEFIDRKEYFDLLATCSTAIFYHYRQQAMGNIIAFIHMGGRVYLSDKNPVYYYLKRIGIVVFEFDKDFKIFGTTRLNSIDIEHNRKVLRTYFEESVIWEESKELVERLLSNDNR